MTRRAVRLTSAPSEMAQEEIVKQVSHLTPGIRDVRFSEGGAVLEFDAPEGAPADLERTAEALATRVQRSLRNLERKLVHRTRAAAAPAFRGDGTAPGIRFLATGQAALWGLPLALFQYFDRVFEAFGDPWAAEPLRVPTLIPVETLARCDYFRSFPHIVTFASHLVEDHATIERFRQRHHDRQTLDDESSGELVRPPAGLSPAVCYHAYSLHAGETLGAGGVAYGMCGKCFRYEASNLRDLRRLWDFTMREVVFLGARETVLAHRERAIGMMVDFLETHELAAEIRTASDPFFVAPDALAKTYFQLSSDTKYEVSVLLPEDGRLAVGSLNHHGDFFGRAFEVSVEGADAMHSVCVAFGLERWVYGFLAQHGADPAQWPAPVRAAPELARYGERSGERYRG